LIRQSNIVSLETRSHLKGYNSKALCNASIIMNFKTVKLSLIIFLFFIQACKEEKAERRTVEIKNSNGKYQLYRNGKPYYIKGAGGYMNLDKLKQYGGNSIRVWSSDKADKILNEAHQLGLTVTLGLEVGRERLGFDYNDEAMVKKQFESLKKEVIKYKDHPALLMWAVGNEVDQLGHNNKVWNAVNEIAEMIHEIDPNHPTTTVIVPHREKIRRVKIKCPEIDILSLNTFDELPNLSEKLREWIWGWNGPYIVTEWGSTGWWESERTAWDAAIELSSTEKARLFKKYYKFIKQDKEKCLGSYVFYWGAKQERTPTWFSLFTETGHETESVHSMQLNWMDTLSGNHSPKINSVYLSEKTAIENIILNANSEYAASIFAYDMDGDNLFYYWEIMPESVDLNGGGDWEVKPQSIYNLIKDYRVRKIEFKAPEKEGPYRLFVYVYDDHNHVATSNIPFYVIQ
jgi:hypothetical protein